MPRRRIPLVWIVLAVLLLWYFQQARGHPLPDPERHVGQQWAPIGQQVGQMADVDMRHDALPELSRAMIWY